MRLVTTLFIALGLMVGATGCEVEQTEEGDLPEFQVEEGQMPEYDVDTADVDVESERRQMEVPEIDVGTREENVEVPDVDVQMPSEQAEEEARPE